MTDKNPEIQMEELVLPLRDDNGDFTFNSVEDLDAFIINEQEQWVWLANSPTPWKPLSAHLKSSLVDVVINLLLTISSNWRSKDKDALGESVNELKNILDFISFPFSCRKTGETIKHEQNNSKIIATNLLYLCCAPKEGPYTGAMSKIVQNYTTVKLTHGNGRIFPINKAFSESEEYRHTANRILTKLEILNMNGGISNQVKLLKKVAKEATKTKDDCAESWSELERWKKLKKRNYDSWAVQSQNEWKGLGKKVLRKVVLLKTDYIRRSSNTLKESEATVENAKQVYLSQVELDAAVTYWDTKKGNHEKSKKQWLTALILLLSITAVSPFLVMKYLPVEQLSDDKLLLNVLNPIALITSILVISLLSFSIRLCSKQFSTQQHLFLEAEERKTMLKTYLALMNEGKLVEQEDRKIALDALFRPAQTGMVSDHGSIVPSDSVIKIIERQSVTAKP